MQAQASMKRLIFRRSAIFPATFLALVFSGCSSVATKDGGGEEAAAADAVTVTKSGDKPAAAKPEAATAVGTPTAASRKKYQSPLKKLSPLRNKMTPVQSDTQQRKRDSYRTC